MTSQALAPLHLRRFKPQKMRSPRIFTAHFALTAHFPCARAHALAEGSAGEGPHQGLPQAAPRGPALPAHPEDPVRPLYMPDFFRTEGRRGRARPRREPRPRAPFSSPASRLRQQPGPRTARPRYQRRARCAPWQGRDRAVIGQAGKAARRGEGRATESAPRPARPIRLGRRVTRTERDRTESRDSDAAAWPPRPSLAART